MKTRG